MPVAVQRSPFDEPPPLKLRTPQARVLAALMPDNLNDAWFDWPTYNRAQLNIRAGFTGVSGTLTRVLNGIRPGSSSGGAHPGLLALELVKAETLDIDGVAEVNYHITSKGIVAYQAYVAEHGALPQVRSIEASTNHRYRKKEEKQA